YGKNPRPESGYTFFGLLVDFANFIGSVLALGRLLLQPTDQAQKGEGGIDDKYRPPKEARRHLAIPPCQQGSGEEKKLETSHKKHPPSGKRPQGVIAPTRDIAIVRQPDEGGCQQNSQGCRKHEPRRHLALQT